MTVYGQRRKKLLSLAHGKQVVAATAANLFYLTDFYGGGVAIVLPDKTVVVTTPLEAERAQEIGNEVEVVVARRWREVRGAVMKQLDKGKVLTDEDSGFRPSARFQEDTAPFLEARKVKDETEVGRVRKASERLDRVFEELPGLLKAGRTEWEVAADVMKLATEQGLTPSGSDSALSPIIVASGENGALPHSELTSRRVRAGDFVVADIFFRFEGYNSDMTRTFAVGRASAEMKKNYAAVREAQQDALDAARAGAVCEDVHKEALATLKSRGVDQLLTHSVGHGVGIEIHELPNIALGSTGRLEVNDVITDEPGIYLKGRYGIRIEDTLRVGKKADVLTRFTKDLVVCG